MGIVFLGPVRYCLNLVRGPHTHYSNGLAYVDTCLGEHDWQVFIHIALKLPFRRP